VRDDEHNVAHLGHIENSNARGTHGTRAVPELGHRYVARPNMLRDDMLINFVADRYEAIGWS
jgi:hypothetical protein